MKLADFSHTSYIYTEKKRCYLSLYVSVTKKVTLRMFGRPQEMNVEAIKPTLFSEHKYTEMKWQHYNTSMRNTQAHNCQKIILQYKKYSKLFFKRVIFIVIMIV